MRLATPFAASVLAAAFLTGCEEPSYDTVVVTGDASLYMREADRASGDDDYYVEAVCGDDERPAEEGQVRLGFDQSVLTVDVRDAGCVVYVHDHVRTVRSEGSEHILLDLPSGASLDRIDADEVRVHGRGDGTLHIGEIYANQATVELDGQAAMSVDYLGTDTAGMSLAGTASLMLEDLRADRWDVHMRGSSTMVARGEVEQAHLDLAGNAELDARDVVVEDVYGDVRGNATVRLTVLDVAELDVRGNATIDLLQ